MSASREGAPGRFNATRCDEVRFNNYDELAPLLLNEVQKQQQTIADHERIIKTQGDQLAEVGARVSELNHQMAEVRQLNKSMQAALLRVQGNAEPVAMR